MVDNRQAPTGARIPADLMEKFLERIQAEGMTKSQGMIAAIEMWLGVGEERAASLDERFKELWDSVNKTNQISYLIRSVPTNRTQGL
jgi:hypothetical protein